ncbi:glycosyltransferase [Pyrofollis japonicus]|uniref:glycosyltransferase n=1 Tax=Pyrofollis japonicus TaxID=3060460 RepID=UPI00295A86D8|nr:glycosyltransferase [Pyrofollis japonicus]BEP18327.1 glycosyltransferase [Pyrofollis japonicus]
MQGTSSAYDSIDRVLRSIGESEIVVGIPSRNVAHTIAYVLHNTVEGLKKYLAGTSASIIVCDGYSNDPTVDIVKAYRKSTDIPIYIIPNNVSKGKGGAIKRIIELVSEYSSAKTLLLIDSDLRSITPEWIPLLQKAAMCGFGAPNYHRHKYDATITNFVARPLVALTFGLNIKQPIGGDFGLSRRLVDVLNSSPLWNKNPWALYFGIDIFLTITALAEGFDVCEALLKAKIHESKDPARHLKSMFIEVTGSTFISLSYYLDSWSRLELNSVREPRVIREPEVPDMYPWEVRVNPELALEAFKEGLQKYAKLYETIFSKNVFEEIRRGLGLSSDTWNKVLIELLAYSIIKRTTNVREILDAMFHIWQGRLYKYYNETRKLSNEEALRRVDRDVKSIIELRDMLLERIKPRLS